MIDGLLVFEVLASRVLSHTLVFDFIFVEFFWIYSILIIDTSVKLSNTDEFGTLLDKEFRSPISYVSETLYNKSLSFNSWFNSQSLGDLSMI